MRNLIARLLSTSTPVILSALALGACDLDGTLPVEDAAPIVHVAALESGATVGWDFDVAVESVVGQYPDSLELSIPVDFEPQLPTRAPRSAAATGAASFVAPQAAVDPDHPGQIRVVDLENHTVIFAAPIARARVSRTDTAWIDVHLVNPCKGRRLCDRAFRLEIEWQGPAPVTATVDLTDAAVHGRVVNAGR